MDKILRVPVAPYLKKYFESENAEVLEVIGSAKYIRAHGNTEIGNLIALVSSQVGGSVAHPRLEKGMCYLSFIYYARNKKRNVMESKIPELAKQLDKMFRNRLCTYVAVHSLAFDGPYLAHVVRFLELNNIVVDVDISKEMARKMYRDYLERNERKLLRKVSAGCETSPV